MNIIFYSRHRGFTLIELMIVIAIIGILVTMGTFTFQASQKRARDSRRKSDLSQIAKALEMYANDSATGSYPGAEKSAGGKINGCGDTGTNTCEWGQPFTRTSTVVYMAQLPSSPSPGNQYCYKKSGYGYLLYASMELPENANILPTKCNGIDYNYAQRSSNITPAPTP